MFIPYKGSAEVVQGVLTGSVDFSIDGVSANLPLIKQGKLRALAKLNNRPLSSLPDLDPLSVAAGMPALGEISTWAGLVAPAGTPPADHRQDSARRRQSRRRPGGHGDARRLRHQRGRQHAGGIRAATIAANIDRWSKVFQDSGIKLE